MATRSLISSFTHPLLLFTPIYTHYWCSSSILQPFGLACLYLPLFPCFPCLVKLPWDNINTMSNSQNSTFFSHIIPPSACFLDTVKESLLGCFYSHIYFTPSWHRNFCNGFMSGWVRNIQNLMWFRLNPFSIDIVPEIYYPFIGSSKIAIACSPLIVFCLTPLLMTPKLICKVLLSPLSSPTCSDAPEPVITVRGMRNVLVGSLITFHVYFGKLSNSCYLVR